MHRFVLAALFTLIPISTSEASMNDRTILGISLDPRVTRCGIEIGGDTMVMLRPFIEASTDLDGSFRLRASRRSGAGTSTTNQAGSIRGGQLGNVTVVMNGPGDLALSFIAEDKSGTAICRLEESVTV